MHLILNIGESFTLFMVGSTLSAVFSRFYQNVPTMQWSPPNVAKMIMTSSKGGGFGYWDLSGN